MAVRKLWDLRFDARAASHSLLMSCCLFGGRIRVVVAPTGNFSQTNYRRRHIP